MTKRAVDCRCHCVDERRLRNHFDLFGYLPYLQCEIDDRLVAYCQHNAASNSSLKSRQRNFDLVSADVQIEKLIAALLISTPFCTSQPPDRTRLAFSESTLVGRILLRCAPLRNANPISKCLSPQRESIKMCTHGGFLWLSNVEHVGWRFLQFSL